MNSKPSLTEINNDLASLKSFWVVLYGSYVSGRFTPRSDIDIAIISTETDPRKNKKIWFELLGKVPEKYDLKLFELLPLEIKASIMDNYLVVFGDALDISEYFYHFRKLWQDSKHRYHANRFTSIKEKLAVLS